MATAAAAKPKPAQPARSAPLPQSVLAGGFVAMPHSFGDLFRHCSLLEMGVLWNIAAETHGRENPKTGQRQEWAKLSEPDFADRLDASIDGIHIAIHALLDEFESPLIEVRGRNGVRREYRLLIENFAGAVRKPRKREPKPVPAPVAVGSAPIVLSRGDRPHQIVLGEPVREVYCQTRSGAPAKVDHWLENGAFHFAIDFAESLPPYSTTGVSEQSDNPFSSSLPPYSSPGVQPGAASQTAYSKAQRLRELREFLTPVFSQLFSRVPDAALLQQIQRRLKGATVDAYRDLTQARLAAFRDRRKIASGLFLNLADDAAAAYLEAAKAAPQSPEKPAAPVAVVHEDENSGSVWMQIRLEMKRRISQVSYQNWFLGTAQARFHARRLLVACNDQITAETLEQEYRLQILAVMADLDLEVERIEFAASSSAGAAS